MERDAVTVALIASIDRYLGLSSDTKPSAPAVGSTFYETDSGETYVYNGSAWTVTPEGQGWRIVRGNYSFADDTGAAGAYTILTVTGRVELAGVYGVCTTACTSGGASTIELGVSGNTAVFIAQATSTALIANEIWHDATPTTTVEAIDMTARHWVVTNGQDVILTIGTADLTAGNIDFYAWWRPVSAAGMVVAA